GSPMRRGARVPFKPAGAGRPLREVAAMRRIKLKLLDERGAIETAEIRMNAVLVTSGSGTSEGAPDERTEENRVFLSINRANRSERRFALAAVLVSAAIFVAALPFVEIP